VKGEDNIEEEEEEDKQEEDNIEEEEEDKQEEDNIEEEEGDKQEEDNIEEEEEEEDKQEEDNIEEEERDKQEEDNIEEEGDMRTQQSPTYETVADRIEAGVGEAQPLGKGLALHEPRWRMLHSVDPELSQIQGQPGNCKQQHQGHHHFGDLLPRLEALSVQRSASGVPSPQSRRPVRKPMVRLKVTGMQ
jgi:hypothetical protein